MRLNRFTLWGCAVGMGLLGGSAPGILPAALAGDTMGAQAWTELAAAGDNAPATPGDPMPEADAPEDSSSGLDPEVSTGGLPDGAPAADEAPGPGEPAPAPESLIPEDPGLAPRRGDPFAGESAPELGSITVEGVYDVLLESREAAPEEAPIRTEAEERFMVLDEVIDLRRIESDWVRRALADLPERPTLKLEIDEVIALALERNPDVQVVEFEPLKARADVMAAEGRFDPTLSGSINYLRASQSVSPDIERFGGVDATETYRTTHNVSLGGLIPYGTQYSVGLNLVREETTFNDLVEEWSGGFNFTLTQPLLRGRGLAANTAQIRIARNNYESALETLRGQLMTTVAEVLRSYWDLVGALENERVRLESLRNAQRLLAINRKRLDIGTGAALEVVQAQAGVATREADLVSARARVEDAEDQLRQLLFMLDQPGWEEARLIPVNRPSIADVALDEDVSTRLALQNRPEVTQALLGIESAEIERKRAANDLLPRLDVSGTYQRGGRDHYLSGVFDGARAAQDWSYSVSVEGSVPIPNRAGRGAYRRALLEAKEADVRLARTENDLVLNVKLAVRAVRESRILVESNRQARILQETNVAAEERKLRLGTSTSFEVLRIQEDLTAAQVQEVQAMVSYERALVDLQLAEGTLLENFNVDFAAPKAAEPTVTFIRSVWPEDPDD